MQNFNNTIGSFPKTRLRRNRVNEWSRRMVRETHLTADNLVLPLFVIEGENKSEEIKSLPDVNRLSVDLVVEKAKEAYELGIPAIALFPVIPVDKKSANGAEALNKENLAIRAVTEIKAKVPDIGIICDVALDPYTSHGHDGVMYDDEILNDETIEILCKQALTLCDAGADIVAPSDMMDGRVGEIRDYLDNNNYENVKILAYSAKYASSFYGPFREALGSSGHLKSDKSTYQMDMANSDEALKEVSLDISEGADIVMIKPGMPYLDIIRRIKDNFNVPIAAYQVSGEYAMMKAAIEKKWLDESVIFESLLSFKRAGANLIFTYFAIDIAKKLKGV
jgi:porphobilinogen synthase